MDINIFLLPTTESVFYVNGSFLETSSLYVDSESVVYLTVLPLDAAYSPYTVKLLGAKPKSNEDLALSCKLSDREYALRLGKRFVTVHNKGHITMSDDICERFFYCVKGGHFGLALELMTKELASSLSEANLTSFFAEYVDLICVKRTYFLVDLGGVGHACRFFIKDGKIDNITID